MPRDRRSKSKEPDADAFIDGGGSTPGDNEERPNEMKAFTTRFPQRLVEKIDQARKDQLVNESRNNWLMKAAAEKLEREG